jgi:ASC-1-like (ASCH) protein
MAIITKKIHPDFFELVKSGKKKFELRLAEFEVKEGDLLILEEWDPEKKEHTGRKIEKYINYVLKFDLDTFGQKDEIIKNGLVILQFD